MTLTKLQKKFADIKDDEFISMTKGQLMIFIEQAKKDAIKTHQENKLFNAEELTDIIKNR